MYSLPTILETSIDVCFSHKIWEKYNKNEEELAQKEYEILNLEFENTVSKTEEYIKELTAKHKQKGVSNNVRIAENTIKQAYDLCRKSGIDADYQVSEYDDNLKITIRIKK